MSIEVTDGIVTSTEPAPFPALEQFAALVAAHVDKEDGSDFIEEATEEALVMIGRRISSAVDPDAYGNIDAYVNVAIKGIVPRIILTRAVKELGAELFYRRQAKNGIVTVNAGMDGGAAIRINRDPWASVHAILSDYIPPAFA